MKKTVLMFALMSVLMFALSGCAMFLDQLKNERGEPMYRNSVTGEMLPESEIPSGKMDEFEPVWSGKPGPALTTLGAILGIVGGPWGAAAGGAIAAVAGVGAAVGNKRKYNVAAAGQEAAMDGMKLAISIVEDLKSGKVDLDSDGKVSVKEMGEYVRSRAKDALKPEFFNEVVRIVTSGLPEAEKAKALSSLKA